MSDFVLHKMKDVTSDGSGMFYWVLSRRGNIGSPLAIFFEYQMTDIIQQYEAQQPKAAKKNRRKTK